MPAQLTPPQAQQALDEIYGRFTLPENRAKLEALVAECNAAESEHEQYKQPSPVLCSDHCGCGCGCGCVGE